MQRFGHILALATLLIAGQALAQFDSGSDGSYGPLVVTTSDPGTVTIPLPSDGIIRATTVSIAAGKTLSFERNELNTPVVILSQGDVEIRGTINVNGKNATALSGGLGGPGGFNGGSPGSPEAPPGDGYGPGAGGAGDNSANSETGAGGGSYSTKPTQNPNARHGDLYGSPLLVPPIGGSGGGGVEHSTGSPRGGGGGGGAILIASSTRISIPTLGLILSFGGDGLPGYTNGGSGGAVRLVAPTIEGNGKIQVFGAAFGGQGGTGRIRVDTLSRNNFQLGLEPEISATVGSFMVGVPDVLPRLSIVQAAGQVIPEGANPVSITLPFGTSSNQDVTIRGADFDGEVEIDLIVTPDNGPRSVYPATIPAESPGPPEATIPIEIPVNTGTVLHVWTR